MDTEQQATNEPTAPAANGAGHSGRKTLLAGLAGVALLVAGAGAGAAGYSMLQKGPASFDPTMPTTPVSQLTDGSRSELKGTVVEIFGNKFVLDDGTGRALVETGKAGEGGKLVAANETVTVQGRFEDGFVHASAMQRADGAVEELRPIPPRPPHAGPRP